MLYSCIHPNFAANIPLSETLKTVGFNGLTSASYWNQQHATETADPPRAFHSCALNPLRRAAGHPTAPKPTDPPHQPWCLARKGHSGVSAHLYIPCGHTRAPPGAKHPPWPHPVLAPVTVMPARTSCGIMNFNSLYCVTRGAELN